MAYKLGKGPAVRPHALSLLSAYSRGKLPKPRAEVPVPAVPDWGMLGNDTVGDCTIAGAGHLILAADAEVGEHDPAPDTPQAKAQYFAITGGQDTGCVEADVLKLWYRAGLFSPANRVAGYAPVDPRDVTAVHQAIDLYGAAYIGVQLPESAQQQFADGEPWTVDPDSPIEGGHCIVLVGYDQQYVQAVTWGAVVNVAYPWLAEFMEECWAVIPQAFVEAGHDAVDRLDLAALQADLALV